MIGSEAASTLMNQSHRVEIGPKLKPGSEDRGTCHQSSDNLQDYIHCKSNRRLSKLNSQLPLGLFVYFFRPSCESLTTSIFGIDVRLELDLRY